MEFLVCLLVSVVFFVHSESVLSLTQKDAAGLNFSKAVRPYAFRTTIPIFYINLDRSIYRNKYMGDLFRRNKNKLSRISGVDSDEIDHFVQGGYAAPGERAVFVSHLKALMAGFNITMSLLSHNNLSDPFFLPNLSRYRSRHLKTIYDEILILEDDASDWPGSSFNGPWPLESIANAIGNTKDWKIVQMQYSIAETQAWNSFRAHTETTKQERIVRSSKLIKSSNQQNKTPNSKFSDKLNNTGAWGAVANLYHRKSLSLLNWPLKKETQKWICGMYDCIYDFIYLFAHLSTPPAFTVRISEGSTGVRKRISPSKMDDGESRESEGLKNDHKEVHWRGIQTAGLWIR